MDRLLCLLRTPTGLRALIVSRNDHASLPTPNQAAEEWDGWPRLTSVPLEEAPRQLIPRRSALLRSWNALSDVEGTSPQALFHLLVVLLETVAEPQSVDLPRPRLNAPAPPHRATAAHPRAFRGTSWKPPRTARPESLNLQPYLGDERQERALLEELGAHARAAGQLLVRAGYLRDQVTRLVRDLAEGPKCDPWSSYHFGIGDPSRARLTIPFRHLASQLDPRKLPRLLALRGRLRLENGSLLHAACGWLVTAQDGLDWLELAASMPPDHQATFAAVAGWANPKPARFDATFSTLHEAAEPPLYLHRLATYLSGLKKGLTSDYLLAGFRLANRYASDHPFNLPPSSSPVPEALIEETVDHVMASPRFRAGAVAALWTTLGILPGLARSFERIPWTSLAPSGAASLLDLIAYFPSTTFPREAFLATWPVFRSRLPRIAASLAAAPPSHQSGFVRLVQAGLWDTSPEILAHELDSRVTLAERLARPPFPPETDAASAVDPILRCQDEQVRREFLAAPDLSFLKLVKACARPGAPTLIGRAFSALVRKMPRQTLEAFLQAPDRLARVARVLGVMAPPEIADLLDTQVLVHPLVREDPFVGSAREVSQRLAHLCIDGLENPLPKKVREHFEGQEELSDAQVERGLRVAREKLVPLRLRLLELLALERLRRGLPADTSEVRQRHALEMATVIDTNRRGLRRLLAHHLAGDTDWIRNHPASQLWFRRHAAIAPELWLSGISLQGEVSGIGRVELSLETDPLEALRLGTYVGSCLSVGGLCAYSAAAVVLDVNKQVRYARDSKGTVVARQLVALSDQDSLVCFEVYPHRTSPELKALFAEYDRRFARALGIPLAAEGGDDVSCVLSRGFWYDGAWDLGAKARRRKRSSSRA